MKLNVISFNIRYCDDDNGNSIVERAPRLKKVIDPYDADVIGFQEYTPLWEKEIKALFLDDYDFFNKYRSSSGALESSPILWRKDKFDCVKTGYFWLSDTPEIESNGWDEINLNRICIYVILRDKETDTEFTFMNTHFGFGNECHKKSANLLITYAKKISALPTFITGDFNLTPDSEAYKIITQKIIDVNAKTVNDTRSTFHGYNPNDNPNAHIDFCFINNQVTPLLSHIIDELVDGKFPSDHYGLLSKIEI